MDFEITTVDDSFEIEPIDLWQTQCFVTSNPYHSLQKESLLASIYNDASSTNVAIKSEVATSAKQHLKESALDFLTREDADLQALNSFLSELIVTVAADVNNGFWPEQANAEATITESWYHITQQGGYHDAHSHPNCSWCGIYYVEPGDVDTDRKSGVNRFYDPRNNADHYLDAGSQYLNSTGILDMTPSEGQIVIFPSYLKHSALPYFGQKDRVVIAFNARVDFI
ncbi:TIGR02466 family protein [Reinekea marina]|uniref:TIGR02466 family protein n=1 Tax=Reinekea marina TaxID=1310421 RepID=A0ABV7WQ93_9GAMM|nr:TIGR02466 family protein [Reinekea marina]MDN3650569.1 TIGR02466 family protein [Reinekea marina]